MNKATSIYLDAVRLIAALIVFASHLASQELSGGRLWFTKIFDQMAVVMFFVLSGYVIGYVAINKEKTLRVYAISRFSRIYSVVIPALILTFALDFIGVRVNPELYMNGPWPFNTETPGQNYALSFFMIHNVWSIFQNPGINGPFWSLSFEWFYYCIFAAAWFMRGNKRVFSLIFLALLGGPEILALLVLWYAGFYAYKAGARRPPPLSWKSATISVACLILTAASALHLHDSTFVIPYVLRDAILSDFACGLFFAIHIYFAPALAEKLSSLLIKFERPIRYFAASSFALYLFHRPIIQLIAAASPVPITELTYYIAQWLITLIVVLPLSALCDKWKIDIKKWANQTIDRLKAGC
jgi:Predicted acyltransferases|tara:strand:+ start:1168 stop:2232 length:1065 start_codon:yes stop_codon:yes gene_type:complete